MMAASIKKILVANRGEIALRIIRAAREMGISTVSIFTSNEVDAPWINRATESYSLGDGDISRTYLNIQKILDIACRSGADAIHPGYGFLSENHLFARACSDLSVNFIGPSPDVLKVMGDKIAAHHLAKKLGIAVPEKILRTPSEMLDIEESLDYPVFVKAAAGGGGKGMRVVYHPHELNAMLVTTSTEALNYFGDDRIYIEKYLRSSRHIEVQLLGDKHGHLVHLFERECSVQRRQQKIIEEAPALVLPESLRQRMIQAALTIGRAVNYFSAGTAEFLLDESGEFYFLEMNPRIQVEHGITEMITGVDIVKEQIAIAEGKSLSFTASDIQIKGHAMEARIFAEDPENDLLPSPGKIEHYCEPVMHHVRIESAVSSGSVITPDYDTLIAKILVHSPSRESTVLELSRALDDFAIVGVQHNIPLLKAIIREQGFLQNKVSTTYLQERMPYFTSEIALQRKAMNADLLAMAAVIRVVSAGRVQSPQSPWQSLGYWRLVPRITLRINTLIAEIDYYRTGRDSMDFYLHNKHYHVINIFINEYLVSYVHNEVKYGFYYVIRPGGIIEISDGSLGYAVERFHRTLDNEMITERYTHDDKDGIIRAPLPGKVISMNVHLNGTVGKGDPLLVIESMKLENAILATCSGQIQDIRVKEGDQVKKNDILLMISQNIHNQPAAKHIHNS